MNRVLLPIPLLGAVACVTADSGRGAGGADNTSSTTASVDSSSTSMAPTADCPTLTTQAECESAGCMFLSATLFPAIGGAAPACEGGTPVSVCTFYVPSPSQSVETFRRDVPAGRIALVTPVVFGGKVGVMGFEWCNTGSLDPCTCF